MRYVAAYLLAVLGGKENPTTGDIEKILSSVGIEADAARLKKVVDELKGKSVDDLIAQGREKLSSMPAGGAAAPAAAAASEAAPAAADKKKGKLKHVFFFVYLKNLHDDFSITIFRMIFCDSNL